MKKNEYFQKEVRYLFQYNDYDLLEEKEDFASLRNSKSNECMRVEVVHHLMDTCEQHFSTPCFAIRHTKDHVDILYLYLLVEDCPIALDVRISKKTDPYSFRFDASQWDDDDLDLTQLPYMPEHVHTKAMNILIWFEDWLKNHSPYRLWFVTQTCDISYSDDAQIVEDGPKGVER